MRSPVPPEQIHTPRKTWFLSGPVVRQWMLALLAANGVGLLTLAVLGASQPVAANRTGDDAVAEALAPLPPVVAGPSRQVTSSNPPPAAPPQETLPKPPAAKPAPKPSTSKQPATPTPAARASTPQKSESPKPTSPTPSASTPSRPSAALAAPQVKPAQPSEPTTTPPAPAKTTPSTPQNPTYKPTAQPPSTSVQRAPQSTSSSAPQGAKPPKAPSNTAKANTTPSGTVKSDQTKPDQPKPTPSKPTPSKPTQPSRTTPPSPAIDAQPSQNTDQPKATYQEEQAAVKELALCALVVDTRQLWPQFQPSATPSIYSRQGQLLWPPRSLTPDPSEPVPDGLLFFARTEEAARELAGTEPDQIRAISSLTTNSGGTDNEAVVVDDADADRVSGLPDHCRVVFLR